MADGWRPSNTKDVACDGKQAFDSRELAWKIASRKARRVIYRCHHCGKWHVGNIPPGMKKWQR